MALVSAGGMGEAVLGYGDGIASEVVNKGQDGGVFSGIKTDEMAVRKEAHLGRGSRDGSEERRRVPVEDSEARAEDANGALHPAHLLHVRVNTDIIKAAMLINGGALPTTELELGAHNGGDGATVVINGHGNRREAGVPVVNGGSHVVSGTGSPDHLVDRVIQCLDEKVDRETLTHKALELLRLVPEGYIPLPHQVGGHRHVDGKLGFLRKIGCEDILYKPVQPGIRGTTEVQFYNSLFGSGELPSEVVRLRQLVPGYYSKETVRDRAGNLHEYLILEDITHRYKNPCIMDVKVGRRVWDDFAEKDKIDRERKKYPAQETLGYRIIGMRVYQPSTGDYVYYDKHYGRSITEDMALQAVSNFFVCGEVNRVDMIPSVLQKLQPFIDWFRTQTSLRLFSTSLLIVYDGAVGVASTPPPPLVDIRLVDFAHTYETSSADGETDNNTLYGLENFSHCLSLILKKCSR